MDAITLRFDVIDMAVTNRDAVVRLCGIVNALELRIAALEADNAALRAALDATFSVDKPCEVCSGAGFFSIGPSYTVRCVGCGGSGVARPAIFDGAVS